MLNQLFFGNLFLHLGQKLGVFFEADLTHRLLAAVIED